MKQMKWNKQGNEKHEVYIELSKISYLRKILFYKRWVLTCPKTRAPRRCLITDLTNTSMGIQLTSMVIINRANKVDDEWPYWLYGARYAPF